eukprot:489016_1
MLFSLIAHQQRAIKIFMCVDRKYWQTKRKLIQNHMHFTKGRYKTHSSDLDPSPPRTCPVVTLCQTITQHIDLNSLYHMNVNVKKCEWFVTYIIAVTLPCFFISMSSISYAFVINYHHFKWYYN